MTILVDIDENTRLLVKQDRDARDPREDGVAEELVEDLLQRWRQGAVYGVIVERRHQWKRVDTDDVEWRWDEDGAIWGCYLDDTYTARMVAAEYFGVPA